MAGIKPIDAYVNNGRWTHSPATASAGATASDLGTSAGVLMSVVINTKGDTNNALIVFDNTSATASGGDTIAVISTTAGAGTFAYFILLKNGLSYRCSGGSTPDFTITYQ